MWVWRRDSAYRCFDELLRLDGLNALETDAQTFDCGNKKGFLGANIVLGLRDGDTAEYLETLIEVQKKSGK